MKRFAENCAPRVAATQGNYGVRRSRPMSGPNTAFSARGDESMVTRWIPLQSHWHSPWRTGQRGWYFNTTRGRKPSPRRKSKPRQLLT